MPVEPERPMTPSTTTVAESRETAPPIRATSEATPQALPTAGAMPGAATATETASTYERIFDARRLLTCLGCLKRTAGHPPPLPAWFLGRHAEKSCAAEDLPASIDEVVVLAAGRRPCASCHPDAALAFAVGRVIGRRERDEAALLIAAIKASQGFHDAKPFWNGRGKRQKRS